MSTYAEYLAQGKTPQEINDAMTAKNTASVTQPPTAGMNASASALTQTGSIPAPEVSPNGMQGLASSLVNKATSVPSNVVDNTGANTAIVQTPEEKAWQVKQDAFNKANPV